MGLCGVNKKKEALKLAEAEKERQEQRARELLEEDKRKLHEQKEVERLALLAQQKEEEERGRKEEERLRKEEERLRKEEEQRLRKEEERLRKEEEERLRKEEEERRQRELEEERLREQKDAEDSRKDDIDRDVFALGQLNDDKGNFVVTQPYESPRTQKERLKAQGSAGHAEEDQEKFNEQERLAVLKLISEENDDPRPYDWDADDAQAAGGDDDRFALRSEKQRLLAEPSAWEKEGKDEKRRNFLKWLPWLLCLLPLLLLGWWGWTAGEATAAVASHAAARGGTAPVASAGVIAEGAAGGHGSAAAAAAFSPAFAAGPYSRVEGGSLIATEKSGAATGVYHEVKNTYGMTAWKREDGKCEIKRLAVDRWDLICDGRIRCSKTLSDQLEPPMERFYCEDVSAAPVFHTASGCVHVTGHPKERRVPGNYLQQAGLKNGKAWYKSDRECLIYWAKTTKNWELWCFSDRWCKKVIPLYMHASDTPTPPEGEWRMQTGRAHGVGPPPKISFETSGKSPERAMKDEVDILGNLDAQKKMAEEENKSLAPVEDFTLHTIHI